MRIPSLPKSPLMISVLAGLLSLIYMTIAGYSPYLLPALLFSVMIGYLVYSVRATCNTEVVRVSECNT